MCKYSIWMVKYEKGDVTYQNNVRYRSDISGEVSNDMSLKENPVKFTIFYIVPSGDHI